MTDIEALRAALDDGKVIVCGSSSSRKHTTICRMVTHEDNNPTAVSPERASHLEVCSYCDGEYETTTAPNSAQKMIEMVREGQS